MKRSVDPSVLIVEDETALTTLLHYNLEREGYRVFEASDGEEALLLADEVSPDLIILDWMLPQLSGIEVCRRMRKCPRLKRRIAFAGWIRAPTTISSNRSP